MHPHGRGVATSVTGVERGKTPGVFRRQPACSVAIIRRLVSLHVELAELPMALALVNDRTAALTSRQAICDVAHAVRSPAPLEKS